VIRTWSREVGNEVLDGLEERVAHVKRDSQQVVMFPQREGTNNQKKAGDERQTRSKKKMKR